MHACSGEGSALQYIHYASGIITFPNQNAFTEGYRFLYGILNFNFFTIDILPFCLWPKATALDMLAFYIIELVDSISRDGQDMPYNIM